jgi:D-alanyl-D-alanine carboxypeptidase
MRGVSWLALVLSLIVFRLPGIPFANGDAHTPDALETPGYIHNPAPLLNDLPPDAAEAATASPSPVPMTEPMEPEELPSASPLPDIPLLIGPNHPISRCYIPANLVAVIPGQTHTLAQEAADAFHLLMAAALDEGIRGLRLISAYRDYATQASLFNARVAAMYPTHGSHAENAAARVVARPGTSEHQSGLAIDISTSWALHTSFGSTPAGIWLAQNAWRFGFILRYPQGKTAVTGVMYEPWHFRYVGLHHAAAMFERKFVLEEYVAWLQGESVPPL